MLGSSSAEERLDCQLLGTQLRYVTHKEANQDLFKQVPMIVSIFYRTLL